MKNHCKIEYRNARAVALWLQNETCYSCNLKAKKPHTHHLDHNSGNNSINNLVVLCERCHVLFHKIPKQPYISRKQIVIWLLKKVAQYKIE